MVKNDSKDKCFYCERPFNVAHYGTNKPCAQTRDHVIPVSRGGVKTAINMVYSCIECNNFKANLLPEDFIKEVKYYIDNDFTFRTIPWTRLHLIIKNTEWLIENFVKVKGESLYLRRLSKPSVLDFDVSNEGEFHIVIKKDGTRKEPFIRKPISKKLKQLSADVHLSVNNNTPKKQHGDELIFLTHQTIEQFDLAKKHGWVVAGALTEPEPNFHYT